MDEATLLKLAEAELLGEAKRAAVRHSTAGPSGWQPCPKMNKSFLVNTLLQTISSNRLLSKKQRKKDGDSVKANKERKLLKKYDKSSKSSNFIYKKPEVTKKDKVKTVQSDFKSVDDSNKICKKHKYKTCKHKKKKKKEK